MTKTYTAKLTFWDKTDIEVDSMTFDSNEDAIQFIIEKKDIPFGATSWSLVDAEGYWIIEEGEKVYPLI